MEKVYQAHEIEAKWAQTWEQSGYFAPSGKGKPYSIVIPPPNVTGSLHMGHGFQQTVMDVLSRYYRMRGFNTLWQVGLDHAGIATQMLVTQKLLAEGKDPHKMARDEFFQAIFDWKEHSQTTINTQMRRLGISVDWNSERFTLDKGLSKAVEKAFIDLYREGLIYRGKRLVNWDPILHTAISDLEVSNIEQQGYLWHIRYPIEDSDEFLVVATTRPETMLGDSAVAVHPKDERYQELIGKYAILPLTERRIPIIADNYVEQEFGTGCVKITPAHDFNDYAVGKRHDLPIINVFTPNATINENAPETYQGLERFTARERIIEDLKAANLLEKIEPHQLKVPVGDRSGAILEPYLTDQWFVKTKPLAGPAIKAVETGKVKFVPESWNKTYLQWLYNIEDWCISRQLIWGHRIPAWYDEKDNIYVGENEAAVRKQYKLASNMHLTQDEDVLDTWFSSALWPFSTLGWPAKTKKLKTFYPTNVLVTGFDIIFFWVARMVMFGLKFTKKIPFKEVYITGLIRDQEGQKMSKSKGNVLNPIDLVDGISLEELIKQRTAYLMQPQMKEKIIVATKKEFPEGVKPHGMDALRFTFCALASPSRDINFDIQRLTGYRNFCNKIWNAARFVTMNFAGLDSRRRGNDVVLSFADKWILSRLQTVIKTCDETIKTYRFDLLTQILHEFIWHEYCDWYLELSKAGTKKGNTIIVVLEAILRLIHPIMPFISEEIWQQIKELTGKNGTTIMLQPYPRYNKKLHLPKIEAEMTWLQKVILGVRNIRGEMNISFKQPLELITTNPTVKLKTQLQKNLSYLKTLAKVTEIKYLNTKDKLPPAATFIIDKHDFYVPLTGVVDLGAELERLQKTISKLEKDIARSKNKLDNSSYVAKAPKEIVHKERLILKENSENLEKLQIRLALLT